MGILVDFHSHFFSRPFFEALAEASPLDGSVPEKLTSVLAAAGIEPPSASVAEHLARWTAELDRYGVGHLVTFASLPQEQAAVAEAVRLSAGRLSGLLVLDPTAPEAPERARAALAEDGYRGVVLFPALHGYRIDGPELDAVLDVLGQARAIAVVHCGLLRIALRDRFRLPRAYDLALANPLALVPVADRHADVRFVVPHFGAGFLREVLIAGAQCENVYVDTSSSNSWVDTQPTRTTLADVFERALGVFGPERILFGTDSSVFPRGWRHEVLLMQREALGACGLSGRDRERILGANAARLLALTS